MKNGNETNEAIDNNGVLFLKINHRTNVTCDAQNIYSRNEVIDNFLYGGLLLKALGVFTHKTPKNLHQFLFSSAKLSHHNLA